MDLSPRAGGEVKFSIELDSIRSRDEYTLLRSVSSFERCIIYTQHT